MISTISKKVAFPDLFLCEALKGSELSLITPPEPSGAAALGYLGRDRFGVMWSFLVSHLPIYKPGERNAMATGGSRQICYGLSDGEVGQHHLQLEPRRLQACLRDAGLPGQIHHEGLELSLAPQLESLRL